ncbi:MAG: anti-sigma regulatory factor [Pedobacter sp.]|uniref:anti-sigma regulatory factor n=1 Tax=Pedobacter sp. TaxID=1411316 RepID=UPI002806659F|nr:anti-sigma regulatory factor [Pedobacter sp.]MDQ8005410.1 anti-sigma regulatory factor [Pedobacter sp.]
MDKIIDRTHISFAANDRSYFALLKKEIQKMAEEAGIPRNRLNELEIIVSEITSNLSKYAKDGEILVGVFGKGKDTYIELISLDNGPGMANTSKMMQDGVTTGTTLGHGLGSIKRLSDTFDIYSQVGWGTILLSRIYINKPSGIRKDPFIVRPLVLAKPGETTSGDGYMCRVTPKGFQVLLADGLGHGPAANEAVNAAVKTLISEPIQRPSDTLRILHPAIKKTRGAVAHILNYEHKEKKWICCGIGNIMLRLHGPHLHKNHMSYNGIVGHNIPNTLNDQYYTSLDYNTAIICSDGIKTRWDLTKYPQVLNHDPSILAAALYKDQGRRTDDMSVIVIKIK